MKVKAHFKVHTSIKSHRNTSVMWSNLVDRAIYCELGRLAMEKWAARTEDKFHISSRELQAAMCCDNAGAAGTRFRAFLTRCEDGAKAFGGRSPFAANTIQGHWEVHFRNFAKKQGLSKKSGTSSATYEDKDEDEDEDEKNKREVPDETSAPKSRVVVTDPVITRALTDMMIRGILTIRPRCKVPKTEAQKKGWDKHFDAMIRLDDRPVQHCKAMVIWLYTENQKREMKYKVFGPEGMREKYDKIGDAINEAGAPERRRKATADREYESQQRRLAAQRPAKGEVASVVSAIAGQMGEATK